MVNRCEKYTSIFFFIINICSDEKVIYSEQFRKQAIDLMNNPTIDAITKSTLKTLSNPTLHGFQSFTKTIEGIGDDRLINVAKAIVRYNGFSNIY